MTKKMWKTIGGKCIYQTPNGAKVHQNYFYRWLTLNSDALQTLINRRSPEKSGLSYVHPLTLTVRTKPADSCLLGLGGAGVAHALAPYIHQSQLHAVENNTEVIQIAKTYFMTDSLKHLSVIHENAHLFVGSTSLRYQHLMVDLFLADSFPTECSTLEFFTNCRRLLLENGFASFNLTNISKQWAEFNHIRSVFFQRTVVLPAHGASNMIVLACNSPSISPLLDLLGSSPSLKKLSWDPLLGCIAII